MTEEKIVPRKVLVIAQRPSDYVEMRRCALALRECNWKVQILYLHESPLKHEEKMVFDDMESLCSEEAISEFEFLFIGRSVRRPVRRREQVSVRWQFRMRYWVGRIIDKCLTKSQLEKKNSIVNFPHRVANFLYTIYGYHKNFRLVKKVLGRHNPDAIILPEDVVGAVTAIIIKAGHSFNIPSVILPYTIANQQEAFRSLSGSRYYQYLFWPNRIIGFLFRRWIMRQGGLALVRLPSAYIVGHIITRTNPPDPWMMNSGFANVIAVENQSMLQYYIEAGIPRSKMEVVGAVSDDELANFKLNKFNELNSLRAELGIESKKPLLVVGGCPDQSNSCPDGFEFSNINEFLRMLVVALEPLQPDYEIVVRPHPNNLRMGEALTGKGLRTTLIDTARLVALSDAYVAFASATIRWAISCGVPTVNYDVFHYNYDDFAGIDGVQNVDNYARFCEAIVKLKPGSDEFATLKLGIARSAPSWGTLDGQSTKRIVDLIDRQCCLERVPRTCD